MADMDRWRQTVSWAAVLDEEFRRHPRLAPQDLRKLVYQACYGGDHLLRDRPRFVDGLLVEWERLSSPDSSEPALQVIHPSGQAARLHLATCRALGLSVHQVIDLLLSQPLRRGTPQDYEWAWAMVLQCARRGDIPIGYERLAEIRSTDDMPHHSEAYGPASYRVIGRLGHSETREKLCRLGLFP